jgi:lysophospholipid acyltransferase (LPLAT)-like uncharacterized protein
LKLRHPLLTKIIALLIFAGMRLLFRTCRLKVVVDDPDTNAYRPTGSKRFIFSIWHDQIAVTVFAARPCKMAGLVSRHQDGSYLADTLELCGIKAIRGSTSRGGAQALRQLMDTARDYHVAITPDGPRGPRRKLKDGIIFLASATGRPIVLSAYSCRRCWRLRGSWTDMMIPKPFTVIYLRGSHTVHIPPNLSRASIESYRSLLEAEMDRLDREAAALARGQSIPISTKKRAA